MTHIPPPKCSLRSVLADADIERPIDQIALGVALPADRTVKRATLLFTADDSGEFYVNGHKAGDAGNFHSATETDVTKLLQPGKNVLAASVKNGGSDLLAT